MIQALQEETAGLIRPYRESERTDDPGNNGGKPKNPADRAVSRNSVSGHPFSSRDWASPLRGVNPGHRG